jgi:ribulose bisphosphate carboxylase small subunit
MGCAHRLARVSGPAQVRHCLEYVFDIAIDYAQIDRNGHAMWEGPQGELNTQRLAEAQARLAARAGGETHG